MSIRHLCCIDLCFVAADPWSLIDLLFTRLEQRWDAWKLEYITFADIMSRCAKGQLSQACPPTSGIPLKNRPALHMVREKEHALIRAPNDAIRTCDVCRINKGVWQAGGQVSPGALLVFAYVS